MTIEVGVRIEWFPAPSSPDFVEVEGTASVSEVLPAEASKRQVVSVIYNCLWHVCRVIALSEPPLTELPVFRSGEWKGGIKPTQGSESRRGNSHVVCREEVCTARVIIVIGINRVGHELAGRCKQIMRQGVNCATTNNGVLRAGEACFEASQPGGFGRTVIINKCQELSFCLPCAGVACTGWPGIGLREQCHDAAVH